MVNSISANADIHIAIGSSRPRRRGRSTARTSVERRTTRNRPRSGVSICESIGRPRRSEEKQLARLAGPGRNRISDALFLRAPCQSLHILPNLAECPRHCVSHRCGLALPLILPSQARNLPYNMCSLGCEGGVSQRGVGAFKTPENTWSGYSGKFRRRRRDWKRGLLADGGEAANFVEPVEDESQMGAVQLVVCLPRGLDDDKPITVV